ncbi:hypothetical protein TSUD_204490 [Trifolium subterraneum]|uniref:Tudor domain-containing protein n=1 Tax=Trifolium subterraneum TaxID=3900 RepID=A0A2Z6PGT5_TRISU|nr:hypothetical protein TSUD_204490 [Trifolium subterraneum]
MQGGGGDEEVNIDELASNLSIYKDQLHQVRQLLIDEPSNSEYVDMERELCEVIALTEELLTTAKQTEISTATQSPTLSTPMDNKQELLDHQDKFPVGTRVQAVYSEDGEWYDATVEAYTPNGYYVSYDSWGNKEEVDPANIRPMQEGTVDALVEAERVAEATKQAIKRKIAQAASVDFQSRSLPAKLRIEPDDPEDVIGFFSGRKRESIFKSPDDPQGKVGVTGSGKGLTEFQKREKHFHLKDGTIENDD